MQDLDQAITLTQKSLSLYQKGHPLQDSSLNTLVNGHSLRYKKLGAMDDLELAGEALDLFMKGLNRATCLNNLVAHLYN